MRAVPSALRHLLPGPMHTRAYQLDGHGLPCKIGHSRLLEAYAGEGDSRGDARGQCSRPFCTPLTSP